MSEQSTRRPTHREHRLPFVSCVDTGGLERAICSGRCTLPVQYQYLYILYLSLNTLVYILIFPRSLRPWLVLETFQLLLHLLNSHELRVPALPVNLNNNGSVEFGMELIARDGRCIALGLITSLAPRNSSTSQMTCFLYPGIILSSAAANGNTGSGRGSVRGLAGITRAQGPSNLAATYNKSAGIDDSQVWFHTHKPCR